MIKKYTETFEINGHSVDAQIDVMDCREPWQTWSWNVEATVELKIDEDRYVVVYRQRGSFELELDRDCVTEDLACALLPIDDEDAVLGDTWEFDVEQWLDEAGVTDEVLFVIQVEIGEFSEYEPWDALASENWVFETAQDEITADTTDREIEVLVERMDDAAHTECRAQLDLDAVRACFEERRDELLAELEEEAS